MNNKRFTKALLTVLVASLTASAAPRGPLPIWHAPLDSPADIDSTGGQIVNPPASFVTGVHGNAFAGNNSAYARWNDDAVAAIFADWKNDAGITVDLYFRGNHWTTHSGHSGLWSIVKRSPDRYFILSIYDGKMRHLFRNAQGEYKYHITGLNLANNITYRLTVRQANGVFNVYLSGGAYNNTSPVFSAADLPPGYTWDFVPAGGSPPREMNVARRAIFDGLLQTGEWVDNVRVYNGFYSPTEIDSASACPLGDLNNDCMVTHADLAVVAANWLIAGRTLLTGNLNSDSITDFCDFALMAADWLANASVSLVVQPAEAIIYRGWNASFHVQAIGPEPITYQWQKDGQNLTDSQRVSGSATSRLEIADANPHDQARYRCAVANPYSQVLSHEADLTVIAAGEIGISPSGRYPTYKGRVIMPTGDSGTQCAAQNSNLDHRRWIDDCADRGLRSVHIWSFVPVRQKQDGSQIEDRWGYVIPDVMPWARKTSGPLAFDQRHQWDLRAFDEGADGDLTRYWPRLRDMCEHAKQRNMLIGITMFTGWSKHDYSWVFHPLNVANGGHLTNKADAVIIASPGVEVCHEPWSDDWTNSKKTQWVWEQFSAKMIDAVGDFGNVFFVFLDEHSYSEGNMGDHFALFFKKRQQIWVDWNPRRSQVAWVMSDTLHGTDKNANAVAGFNGSPPRPYINLEGPPYMGDDVRTSIWTFSMGAGAFIFHADENQETVRTGIMGYDPHVPDGDKGMYKRDWLGHASRFFNDHIHDLDSMTPANALTSTGEYCLAHPGREYAVYSMTNSPAQFTLNLTAADGNTLTARFYDPKTGLFQTTFNVAGGSPAQTFTKPNQTDWVLHLLAP